MKGLAARVARSCLIILAMSGSSFAVAGQTPPGEYDVKAAFVYNFFKFIDWPSRDTGDAGSIRICIAGDLPGSGPLERLDGQEVIGKKLVVSRLARMTDVAQCRVLFIASSEERQLSTILAAVKGSAILTIGDAEGFARRGVIINFIIQDKKVRFEMNADAARQAGLKISSKLMKLASTVYGAEPAGD